MSAYSDRIVADGASNYWRLNQTSGLVAVDSVGGADGTISGGVTLGAGGALSDGDKAMLFNGSTGQIVTTAQPAWGTGPVTAECWVKRAAATGAPMYVVDNKVASTPNAGLNIFFDATTANASVANGVAAAVQVGNALGLDNLWHHITAVVERGATDYLRLYVDGVVVQSAALPAAGWNLTAAGPIILGTFRQDAPSSTNHFLGSLDDVAIYPRALQAWQIAAHYSLGRGTAPQTYPERVAWDGASNYWRLGETSGTSAVDSVGGKTGTISGGVTLNQAGAVTGGDGSMRFDGTSGKIATAAAIAMTLPYTIEAWVKTGDTVGERSFVTGASAVHGYCGVVLGHVYSFTTTTGFNGTTIVATNTWRHVVLVFTATTITSYVDGVLDVAAATAGIVALNEVVEIGYRTVGGPSNGWLGSIDDVAIYPRALTPAEILAHYDLGKIPPPQTYAERVVSDGASNFWRLGETSGTTAIDIVSAKNGTISGGVTLAQPGATVDGNKAMAFPGTDTAKILAPNIAFLSGATALTWEVWARPSVLGVGFRVAVNPGDGTTSNYIGVDVSGLWVTSMFIAGAQRVVTSTVPASLAAWHHLLTTYDGTTIRFYVNGALAGSLPIAGTLTNTGGFLIGNWSVAAYGWLGSIDDVAIYPRALTATEIAQHYTLGTVSPLGPRDLNTGLYTYLLGVFGLSAATSYVEQVRADGATNHWRLGETSGTTAVDAIGGANGTISGGVTLNQPSALADGNAAMLFDGTTGKIEVAGNVALPTAVTIEAWVKVASSNMSDYTAILSSRFVPASLQFGLIGANYPFVYVTGGTPAPQVNSTVSLAVGLWHHVVLIHTSAAVTFYVNGVLDTTVAMTRGAQAPAPVGIGTNPGGSNLFPGSLDDVVVYPRALTAAEIGAHYTLGRSGLSGGNDLTTLITRYLATLTGDMTARWKQMEKNAGF